MSKIKVIIEISKNGEVDAIYSNKKIEYIIVNQSYPICKSGDVFYPNEVREDLSEIDFGDKEINNELKKKKW